MSSSVSIDRTLEFLKSEPVRIAVFGEFSSGKSTFLNALMGEDILSVAVEPTTAVPTYIRYGRSFNIIVCFSDSAQSRLFEDEVPSWARLVGRSTTSVLHTLERQKDFIRGFLKTWTKEGEKADQVSHVIIEMPLQLLSKGGIELVDTPGVNNEFTKHRQYTESVAVDTDIAILLLDARGGGARKSEFEFMNEVGKTVDHCIVVLNKIDAMDEDERDDVLDHVRKSALPQYWASPILPKVFGVSSLSRLNPDMAEKEPSLVAAFAEMLSYLENLWTEHRGAVLLKRAGNPERKLFDEARRYEGAGEWGKAHDEYHLLHELLCAAGVDAEPALAGIARVEEKLVKTLGDIDKGNALVNEVKGLAERDWEEALKKLGEAMEYFENIGERDEDLLALREKLISRISNRETVRDQIQSAVKKSKRLLNDKQYFGAVSALDGMKEALFETGWSPYEVAPFHSVFETAYNAYNEWRAGMHIMIAEALKLEADQPDAALEIMKNVSDGYKKQNCIDNEVVAIFERMSARKNLLEMVPLQSRNAMQLLDEKQYYMAWCVLDRMKQVLTESGLSQFEKASLKKVFETVNKAYYAWLNEMQDLVEIALKIEPERLDSALEIMRKVSEAYRKQNYKDDEVNSIIERMVNRKTIREMAREKERVSSTNVALKNVEMGNDVAEWVDDKGRPRFSSEQKVELSEPRLHEIFRKEKPSVPIKENHDYWLGFLLKFFVGFFSFGILFVILFNWVMCGYYRSVGIH